MIYGVGTDIVAIERIRQIRASQYGERFVARLLTESERELIPDRLTDAWLAKRWAGKEAIAKALKTGIGKEIGFHDMVIQNEAGGAPTVVFSQKAGRFLRNHSIENVALSLSDEKEYALAFAVAYRAMPR